MTVPVTAQSQLQVLVVTTLVLSAVFLAVAGILEGDFGTAVWVAVVLPLLFDWRITVRGKPSAIRPDSPRWQVAKLVYVLALGVSGTAILAFDDRAFARIAGLLLIVTTLCYFAAFYDARRLRPQTA